MKSYSRPNAARRVATAAGASLIALCVAMPAMAHGPAPEGMSAAKVQEFESKVLGHDHAAVHASQRAVVAERAAQRRADRRLAAQCRAARAGRIESGRSLLRKCERRAAERRRVQRRIQARVAALGPASEVGAWTTPPFNIPVMAIHAALLPTGKVMWFSYPRNPNPAYNGGEAPNTAQAWLWDPATGQSNRVDPPLFNGKPANIWCAGQTFTKDGRLVVIGGNLDYSTPTSPFKGLNKIYTFNPFTETWTEQPDMRHGRWYPTGVRLPDGRIPIVHGLDENGAENQEIEVFTPSADMNGRGTVEYLGSSSNDIVPTGPRTGDYYPHMFVMPSGNTLVAGPSPRDSWFLRPLGTSPFFTEIQDMPTDRVWGTGVLMPNLSPGAGPTRAMLMGGSVESDAIGNPDAGISVETTTIFDEADQTPPWQPGPPMSVGRGHANTRLLPDGSMVEIGGGVGTRATPQLPSGDQWQADPAQKQVEVWDGDSWELGPPQVESRAYHSTALLLPDGRVISAGDDVNGGIDQDTAEIYSPPYLFKGARPAITSAPSCVRLGETFSVGAVGGVARATFVAPGATTHANDMNQRFLELAVSPTAGGASVTVPGQETVAIPGYYMLFVLNAQGVPSVAKFVRVLGPADPDCPVPPPGGAGGGPSGGGGPAAADKTAPRVGLRVLSSKKLSTVLKRGLLLRVQSSERSTVALSLMLDGRQAKRARLSRRSRATRIASKKVTFTKAGAKRVRLKIAKKAGRRLARSRLRTVKLTVVSKATDQARNSRTTKMPVRLPRR